jgi:hypothetical protein
VAGDSHDDQGAPGKDIMFLGLNEGKPKGFLSNFGYVDVKDMSADEVSELIVKRLEDDAHER